MQATAENWPSGYPANGTQLHEELFRNESFLPTFLTVDPRTKRGERQKMISSMALAKLFPIKPYRPYRHRIAK
ncbi:hypothetical protein ABIE58_002756 [Roseovarius sp. MBR-78]|uniref:hypothetical protein n=1 Tax=Roseovarius sp. MBR-78 TaxID=3156460 RepID=UPI0033998BC5